MDPDKDIQVFGVLHTGKYIGQDAEGYMYRGYMNEATGKVDWEPILRADLSHWQVPHAGQD